MTLMLKGPVAEMELSTQGHLVDSWRSLDSTQGCWGCEPNLIWAASNIVSSQCLPSTPPADSTLSSTFSPRNPWEGARSPIPKTVQTAQVNVSLRTLDRSRVLAENHRMGEDSCNTLSDQELTARLQEKLLKSVSRSVVSDSLQPHGL